MHFNLSVTPVLYSCVQCATFEREESIQLIGGFNKTFNYSIFFFKLQNSFLLLSSQRSTDIMTSNNNNNNNVVDNNNNNNDIQLAGQINCGVKFDTLGRRYPTTRRSEFTLFLTRHPYCFVFYY